MPRIFYWMVDARAATGGEKHSYEHVDILNDAGFDAYALHPKGARYTWFANRTRTIRGGEFWNLFDPREDYLVLPETLGDLTTALPGKKVIFNKNLYTGCVPFGLDRGGDPYPYGDPDVVAIFAVSDHNLRHLQYAFPSATIFRMYAHIDPAIYRYRPLRDKRPRIVVTNKAKDPLAVLLMLVQARAQAGHDHLARFEVRLLQGLSNGDAAALLGESLMLVSLSTYEGLPRTVLEAMSCGCVVAAYRTGPLAEILPPEYGFEPDDLVSIAQAIDAVARAFPHDLDRWTPSVERGRQTAAAFSATQQRTHLLNAWREILAGADGRTRAHATSGASAGTPDSLCIP